MLLRPSAAFAGTTGALSCRGSLSTGPVGAVQTTALLISSAESLIRHTMSTRFIQTCTDQILDPVVLCNEWITTILVSLAIVIFGIGLNASGANGVIALYRGREFVARRSAGCPSWFSARRAAGSSNRKWTWAARRCAGRPFARQSSRRSTRAFAGMR
jgi:hypothetical protein